MKGGAQYRIWKGCAEFCAAFFGFFANGFEIENEGDRNLLR